MNNLIKTLAFVLGIVLLAAGQARAAETVTYYHHDALGSVIASSNEYGGINWNEEFQPYGRKIYNTVDTAGGSDEFYTGKNYNRELGLTYFGARWYDDKQGRFLSMDPAPVKLDNIHSFNRYVYASNNPYKYVDPDGMEVIVSAEMQPLVDNVVSKSDTARSIVNRLDNDPRKFFISSGNDPSGGSTRIVKGSRTTVIERMFFGKKDGPDSMHITVNLNPKSHTGFIDENERPFTSSAERIFGHELGHANIWAGGGDVGFMTNQVGAVDIENRIAQELNPDSPVRHRSKGHGIDFTKN